MRQSKSQKPSNSGGTKHDSGKPRLSLISSIALFRLAEVLTDGEIKYASHNWRKGFKWSRIVDALMRHLSMWNAGMDKDPDSGRSNLGAVLFCAMVLAEFEETHKELDDRHKLPLDTLYNLYPPKDKNTIINLLKESQNVPAKKTAYRKAKRRCAAKTKCSKKTRR